MAAPKDKPGGDGTGKHYWLSRDENRLRSHFGRTPSRHERRREGLLRDWYGPDYAPAEIEALQKPARRASDLVDDVLSTLGFQESVVLGKVAAAWEQVVGTDAARRSVPVALQHGVLTVEVANATWRYVLKREHYTQIVARLRDLTAENVRDVRFVPPGRYSQ